MELKRCHSYSNSFIQALRITASVESDCGGELIFWFRPYGALVVPSLPVELIDLGGGRRQSRTGKKIVALPLHCLRHNGQIK